MPGSAECSTPADGEALRILAVSETWQGGNDHAFVRAFRRQAHFVATVVPSEYFPRWRSRPLRAAMRLLRPRAVAEFNHSILRASEIFRPHLFFVFKGAEILPETIDRVRANGAVAIQYYPDVSFHTHGPLLPKALPRYDWIFTTKSFGLDDMRRQLGVESASLLLHGFDPETHCPTETLDDEIMVLSSQATFVGNWSPKKEALLAELVGRLHDLDLKIWGPPAWNASTAKVAERFQGHPVRGSQYAKAIGASKINIALLSEQRRGASSGDVTTSRTFEIPGAGGFMLHERTEEAMALFEEGKEAAFFSGADELAEKVAYYLDHEDERAAIADAGRRRAIASFYSTDDRAKVVLQKYQELKAARSGTA